MQEEDWFPEYGGGWRFCLHRIKRQQGKMELLTGRLKTSGAQPQMENLE